MEFAEKGSLTNGTTSTWNLALFRVLKFWSQIITNQCPWSCVGVNNPSIKSCMFFLTNTYTIIFKWNVPQSLASGHASSPGVLKVSDHTNSRNAVTQEENYYIKYILESKLGSIKFIYLYPTSNLGFKTTEYLWLIVSEYLFSQFPISHLKHNSHFHHFVNFYMCWHTVCR